MDESINALITEFVEATGRRPQQWEPDWRASWNIAPTQQVPLLVESARGPDGPQLRFEQASWSLVPRWSETLKTPYPTFNARSETAHEKPVFRDAVRSTRAIVFANGYYEWVEIDGEKRPHFIRREDGDPLGFAGLYSWWADPALAPRDPARWHLTATILTAPAAPHLAELHPRSPVVLPPWLWERWIDTSLQGDRALLDEMTAAGAQESEELDFYPVAPLHGDGPELMEPIGPSGLAESAALAT